MKKLLAVVMALALLAGFVLVVSAAPKHPTQAQLQAAKKIGRPVFLTNSIGMKFVLIPAGSFMMGSPPSELKRDKFEGPQHRIVISRPLYLQTTEVTQAQYRAIMGQNPSDHQGCDRCPVENVTWDDAQAFIRRLNAREKTDKYRLPTEAEWEYAARAGTTTVYYYGNDPGPLGVYAWYTANSGNRTHPVARKRPNRWGLFDMHGNVWEWCQDGYDPEYYSKSPPRDPRGAGPGAYRVLRGGSCFNDARILRSALRGGISRQYRFSNLGFRVVRMP